jgi:hypothetical protein
MMWRYVSLLLVLGSLPILAATDGVPSFDEFALILKRNVFDSTRVPYREPQPRVEPTPRPTPAPLPTPKTMTLAGVFLADDRAVALFVGGDGACRNVAKGDQVEGLTVEAVDAEGVRLKTGERELKIAVGEQLSDGGKEQWSVVGQAAQAPSVDAVAEERKAADRNDLLKRLMERRKRELGK